MNKKTVAVINRLEAIGLDSKAMARVGMDEMDKLAIRAGKGALSGYVRNAKKPLIRKSALRVTN